MQAIRRLTAKQKLRAPSQLDGKLGASQKQPGRPGKVVVFRYGLQPPRAQLHGRSCRVARSRCGRSGGCFHARNCRCGFHARGGGDGFQAGYGGRGFHAGQTGRWLSGIWQDYRVGRSQHRPIGRDRRRRGGRSGRRLRWQLGRYRSLHWRNEPAAPGRINIAVDRLVAAGGRTSGDEKDEGERTQIIERAGHAHGVEIGENAVNISASELPIS